MTQPMIETRDMPVRLNRALQVRTADRLRASLARDEVSGLPLVSALSDQDQRELRNVGGGLLGAVVMHVTWATPAAGSSLPMHEIHALVMREVARLVGEHVRRTDLLGSWGGDALLLLAAGLDALDGESLRARLRDLLAEHSLEVGAGRVQIRVKVEEAERDAMDRPPIASVA